MHRVKPTVKQIKRRRAKRRQRHEARIATIREQEQMAHEAETDSHEIALILGEEDFDGQRMIA